MSEHLLKRVMVVVMAMIMVLTLMLNNVALLPYLAFAQSNNNANKLVITDGVASGGVTDNSAIIWSRANAQALMHAQYDTNLSFSHAKSKTLLVDKLTDFAGHIKLDSLYPETLYYYRVWFSPTYENVNTNSKESSSLSTSLPKSDSIIG